MHNGFGSKILYCGPRNQSYSDTADHNVQDFIDTVEHTSFEDLLKRSDIITIHCPLTSETRHMFNGDAFTKMKSSAILINTSRGSIVDQDALYSALKSKTIAGAGLHVFYSNPPSDPAAYASAHHVNMKLMDLPNCTILPYIA